MASPILTEESVLTPISPNRLFTAAAPAFELRNTIVSDQRGNLVSLFDVRASREPYTVQGTLIIEPETRGQLLLDLPQGSEVEIVITSASYSYSEGPMAIWAAGKAGWFEISPARPYEGHYQEMLRAVQLYYELTDWHANNSSETTNSIEQFLYSFAMDDGTGITSLGLEALFRQHCVFLLWEMLLPNETGVTWSNTMVFKHLSHQFPEIFKELSILAAEYLENLSSVQPSIENQLTFRSSPEPATNDPTTYADWAVMVILQADGNGSCPKEKLTIPKLSEWVYRFCAIDPAKIGVAAIRLNAKKIIAELPNSEDWKKLKFYKELENIAANNPNKAADETALEPFQEVRVRRQQPRPKTKAFRFTPRLDRQIKCREDYEKNENTPKSDSESAAEGSSHPTKKKTQRSSKALPISQAAHRSGLRPTGNTSGTFTIAASEPARSLKRRHTSSTSALPALEPPHSPSYPPSPEPPLSPPPPKFPAPRFYPNGEKDHEAAEPARRQLTIEAMSLVEAESRNLQLPNTPAHLVEYLIERGKQAKAEEDRKRQESGRQLGVGSRSSPVKRIVRSGI
ncbi:hypothetical protein B7494_g1909 [Chlorociboria aeruginascens]|nr:hypothetical protein B7494_g1909 [Chlorociboria aeruginascens]